MLLLNDLLRGVPTDQQPNVLAAFITSSWAGHFENMKLARLKGNPLAEEALREVAEGKFICRQALDSDLLTNTTALSIAKLYANLHLPSVTAIAGMGKT